MNVTGTTGARRAPDSAVRTGSTALGASVVLVALIALLGLPLRAHAQALTRMVFGTNWYAQAEHGGFYQALAEGLYRKAGLDVDISMGGAQINGLQLLLAGRIDLFMGYDIQVLQAREQGLPLVTVAAAFQKDPSVIIAHPDIHRLADLKGRPIYIGAASNTTFWPWLRSAYAFTDEQKRPYAFSVQPFLVDKRSATQGYVTSEPYSVAKGGVTPSIFLLADLGYPPYAQTIVVTQAYLQQHADAIRRFVEATAQGYKQFLVQPEPGNQLIRKANPQMEEGLLRFGLERMREYGLVTGGDAVKGGIMTMTDERWQRTRDFMVEAGLLKATTKHRDAYTLDVVHQVKVLP